MSNFLNIPFCCPIKFYPNTATPNIHFDDDWFRNRILSFESKPYYQQKIKRTDVTTIEVEATIAPDDLKIYKCNGTLAKTVEFEEVADSGSLNYKVYRAEVVYTDEETLPDGVYYFYIKSELLSVKFEAISEPVWIKANWPNTLLFKYKNSKNEFGSWFKIDDLEYQFRCEAGIMDFQPDRDRASYVDEIHNVKTLSATPFRTWKLYIGTAPGCPPYVFDILNRIFCCDHVLIADKLYETTEGAKWEMNRVKPWPMYGGSIEITDSINQSSLQMNNLATIAPGIIIAYLHETDFFGEGVTDKAAITETEQTN